MPSDNQDNMSRLELDLFWKPYNRKIARLINPLLESTDPEEQKLGTRLMKQEAKLRKRLARLSLKVASQRTQEFFDGINEFYTKRNDYLRAKDGYETARLAYEETAKQLGLSLSLPSLQVTSASEITPPTSYGYRITREEKRSMRESTRDVIMELITQPASPYNDGLVPVQVAGEEVARRVFGDNYREGRRHGVVTMMIANNPERYGLTKSEVDGKTYVKPSE